jgi:hypothetical protein
MENSFITSDDKTVRVVPFVSDQSVLKGIIEAYHPEARIIDTPGRMYNYWDSIDAASHVGINKDEALTLIAHPVHRFREGIKQFQWVDINILLSELNSGVTHTIHTGLLDLFAPISGSFQNLRGFKYPNHVEEFRLAIKIPEISVTDLGAGISLTPDQEYQVTEIYKKDLDIYNELIYPNQFVGSLRDVPNEVSSRQFKLQLYYNGDLQLIEHIVAQQPEPIQIEWGEAASFKRDNASLLSMREALFEVDPKWGRDYLDKIFIEANKISL